MSPINFFDQHIEGKWLTQNNNYILNTKKRKSYLRELNIQVTQTPVISHITSKHTQNIMVHINHLCKNKVLRIYKINHSKTTCEQIDHRLIKVNYTKIENKYYYEEYIYLFNANLIFSVGILKNKHKYNYIGIMITSYIKLND
uniref:Uncharacterized protein n=1 Tax=Osmundea sinicola TaxID=290685 RepID=A0A7L4WNM7_9FLOR|nr:hypothetical protein [Osmundea sinicola]QFR99870.1 hypothetical protein [Osmundea sinicola]